MSSPPLVLVLHDSALRVVSEAEAIATLSIEESARPRRIERLDTRPLQDDVEGGHWRSAHVYMRREAARLRALLDELGVADIRYFGIAEVPQVLALGAYLGDERLIQARDYDRDRNVWEWPRTDATLAVATINPVRDVVHQAGPAVLRVEISYPVLDADIDAAIGAERLSDIRIVPDGRAPTPGLIQSAEDVTRVRLAVREALAMLASARPHADVINLFVAAPVSVCLAIGQELRLRNGKDVQTYRYRSGTGDRALTPAILLTSGDVNERAKPRSSDDLALARDLRSVWQRALEEVREHALNLRTSGGEPESRWYCALEPRELLRSIAPFPGLRPMHELIEAKDRVSLSDYADEFEFDKDAREWRLGDDLVLAMFDAAGGDRERLREHARLFFWHEYVHDGQGLTADTSIGVGRLANCLERVDYLADTYAVLHQVDLLARQEPHRAADESRWHELLLTQLDVALRSFWAFEPPPPVAEIQERRLRRYLNWYWRRVQLRDNRDLRNALSILSQQPCIEISGLRRRLGGGRIYVVLDDPGGFERLHIGVVLEDGRLKRRGSSTDASIEELLRAFARYDRPAIERFFSALVEQMK